MERKVSLFCKFIKELHWAIDQIKVRSKKVITSWYQEFLAGGEIVVNDVPIKKGSADNKVVINGKEVDLTVTSITTDNNTGITADGLYFIEAGLDVAYSNTGTGNKILINDSPTGEKPVVTCSNTITLEGASLVCKNIALVSPSSKFLTIKNSSAPFVTFDGCDLNILASTAQEFLDVDGMVMENFSFCNSKMKIERNSYRVLNIGLTQVTFPKVQIENSVFYAPGSGALQFKLVFVNNDNNTQAGITSFILRNTTFINAHYLGQGIVSGDISEMIVEKNIIYADNNNNNVTVFRRRGGKGTSIDLSGTSLEAASGNIVGNIGYIVGAYYLNLWQGNTPPLENAEKIQKLDASPFKSLDKPTGTYVLKPEYQGYGATIE